jgi:hypothetical protein
MARQLVTPEKLLEILNERLKQHPGGGDECSFPSAGLHQLKGEDDEGCNWVMDILRGSGIPAQECVGAAHDVVRRARREFNLK